MHVRRDTRGPALATALLTAGLILVGCGSTKSAATAHAPSTTRPATTSSASTRATSTTAATTTTRAVTVDSCTAVTQAEAGQALGQTVGAPVRGKATVEGGVACVFYGPSAPTTVDADVPVPDSVRVVLVTGAQGTSYFDDYRSKVPAQAVAGLGDQAFYDGSASLSVLKGSDYLRIAVIGVPDVLAAEKQLAAAAVGRL